MFLLNTNGPRVHVHAVCVYVCAARCGARDCIHTIAVRHDLVVFCEYCIVQCSMGGNLCVHSY